MNCRNERVNCTTWENRFPICRKSSIWFMMMSITKHERILAHLLTLKWGAQVNRINICFRKIYKLIPLLGSIHARDVFDYRERRLDEGEKQLKKGQIHFQLNNFLRVIQLDLILFKSTSVSVKELLRYFFLWWWNCFSNHELNISSSTYLSSSFTPVCSTSNDLTLLRKLSILQCFPETFEIVIR